VLSAFRDAQSRALKGVAIEVYLRSAEKLKGDKKASPTKIRIVNNIFE